jgi:hypothetical protein
MCYKPGHFICSQHIHPWGLKIQPKTSTMTLQYLSYAGSTGLSEKPRHWLIVGAFLSIV